MDPKSRFDLSESVGRDELGEVFRATERDSGKNAAVKVFDAWAVANLARVNGANCRRRLKTGHSRRWKCEQF